MTEIEQTLRNLAAQGHSRTSAFKVLGWSWHTFRKIAADYPDITWRTVGGVNGIHKRTK